MLHTQPEEALHLSDHTEQHASYRLIADEFLRAADAYMRPLLGTHIYELICRDLRAKTEQVEAGYAQHLKCLIPHLTGQFQLCERPAILDFGCGTGELTVLMNVLGYNAIGIDVHSAHIALARILARENGLEDSIFVLNREHRLPFPDKAFDIITLFVVLEHMGEAALAWVLPELRRICRGVVYVLVPNRIQTVDDHTGLAFVPWMPRRIAAAYVHWRGQRYRYGISDTGTWDVNYRSFWTIRRRFKREGFDLHFPPDSVVFPPITPGSSGTQRIQKRIRLLSRGMLLRIPIEPLLDFIGVDKRPLYSYLNLIFKPSRS
jgi:SAM-dependent methyltransferase